MKYLPYKQNNHTCYFRAWSAKTGWYVTLAYARRYPKVTVVEKVKR